jgi:HSP20 family molecular chaperone IbpA
MAERDNANGGLGFEGLLRNIGDMLHQAANMSAAGRRDGQRPMVESRMSIRSVDGEDIGADFFGLRDLIASATASAKGNESDDETPRPPERREPAVELFATSDAISAIVELPGAEAASLTVRVEHDMLTIAASGCGIDYGTEALLPNPVDDAAREQSFRNGVLELKWPRVKAQK